MSQFVIQNLNKKLDGKVILDDITIRLDMGSFLAILGPSGCGKSTLLKIIAGIEHCDTGDILLDNQRLNELSPKDRDIAMVFQSYALYPNFTVHGNIEFGLKNRKVPKLARKKIVRDLVQMLKIEKHLDKKPAKLSGGERQRVAIARALAREPKLFLFDEPLSNLDAELRQQMRVEIKRIHQELGITSIYVTHDQIEAMTLGDTLVIMKEGKIQQVGNPKEIYQQPENLFVAGFIGSPPMNFISVVIVKSNGKSMIKISHEEKIYLIPIQVDIPNFHTNKSAQLGFRPNQVYLVNEESAIAGKTDKKFHIETKVKSLEYTGGETFLIAELNGSQVMIKTTTEYTYERGESIKLVIDISNIFLFDQNLGDRIL